jgi:hypothetical protein
MTAKILPSSTLPAVNCNAEHAANIRAAAANNSCGTSFFPMRTVYSLTVNGPPARQKLQFGKEG